MVCKSLTRSGRKTICLHGREQLKDCCTTKLSMLVSTDIYALSLRIIQCSCKLGTLFFIHQAKGQWHLRPARAEVSNDSNGCNIKLTTCWSMKPMCCERDATCIRNTRYWRVKITPPQKGSQVRPQLPGN